MSAPGVRSDGWVGAGCCLSSARLCRNRVVRSFVRPLLGVPPTPSAAFNCFSFRSQLLAQALRMSSSDVLWLLALLVLTCFLCACNVCLELAEEHQEDGQGGHGGGGDLGAGAVVGRIQLSSNPEGGVSSSNGELDGIEAGPQS